MINRWRTDTEFAVDLRARDSDAWALAYVRYLAPMRSVARRFGPLGQADDVVHEVFAQFWDRPDQFDPGRGSLRGYLLTMTQSRSIDVYREDVARRRRETRDLEEGQLSSAASVEADALAGITTDELIVVIRMLPRSEREAIGLAFFRHLSYQQVATTLGVPEGTIKSRIRAGLLRMRTALGELGLVDDPLPGEVAPSDTDPIADP
ncbi:MAG: RNA polymerase sigma factor [Solirubrobacterales bacterium]